MYESKACTITAKALKITLRAHCDSEAQLVYTTLHTVICKVSQYTGSFDHNSCFIAGLVPPIVYTSFRSDSSTTRCLLLANLGRSLAGTLSVGRLGSALLHGRLLFGKDDLDVAWVRHVRVDSAVRSVRASATNGCLLDLDVVHLQGIEVETLVLGVGLGVFEEVQQELRAFLGPASLRSKVVLLSLRIATNTTGITTERDSLLLLNDVLQETLGLLQRQTLDGSSSLAGILEVNSKVRTTGLARLRSILGFSGVFRHFITIETAWSKGV